MATLRWEGWPAMGRRLQHATQNSMGRAKMVMACKMVSDDGGSWRIDGDGLGNDEKRDDEKRAAWHLGMAMMGLRMVVMKIRQW